MKSQGTSKAGEMATKRKSTHEIKNEMKARGKKLFPEDECCDCKDRPTYLLKDISFGVRGKRLCNRHFYLFSKKFEKWFLEDKIPT